eukprot:1929917-Rhodomonas_salina.1
MAAITGTPPTRPCFPASGAPHPSSLQREEGRHSSSYPSAWRLYLRLCDTLSHQKQGQCGARRSRGVHETLWEYLACRQPLRGSS